ncbi:hypothetical protein [Hydrocoleum sp. CS-953]|uniref:hypothetical protein n=1 Tax=Hydrocoleum sp. CS-953 TaxID=1671698 RepID=UPI00117A50A9|nr:hypothetical protein [Hydrocoleum sp. CS-953]
MEPISNKKQSNFPNSTNQNSTQPTTKQAGKQNNEMFVCLDDNELEKVTGGASGAASLAGYAGVVYLDGD